MKVIASDARARARRRCVSLAGCSIRPFQRSPATDENPASVLIILSLSGPALAQPATTTQPPFQALLSEVRLLRLAIERQTQVRARSHILVARQSSLEQGLIRVRAQQDSLESKISDLRAKEDQLRTGMEQAQAALENPIQAARRKDLENRLGSIQHSRLWRGPSRTLQARRAVAEQSAENERHRH